MSELTPGYPALHDTTSPFAVFPEALKLPAGTVAGFATGTITIGGTPTTGDAVTATINGHGVTINPTTGQSAGTVATNLAAAINGDSTDAALVSAAANGAVVSITALAAGSAGMLSLAASATGGHTTATAGASALDLAAGIIIPKHTFSWVVGNQTLVFYQDTPYTDVDSGTKAAMRTAGEIY